MLYQYTYLKENTTEMLIQFYLYWWEKDKKEMLDVVASKGMY